MSTVENNPLDGLKPQRKSPYARQLDAIAWALLLIWIGVAVLADVGWGWVLLGIGGIVLGAQGALWQRSEAVDSFAVTCGIVFLIGGAWIILGLTWPLAPVLLILLGVGVLWNAMFSTRSD
jgi:hypothetical protein